MKRIKMHWAKKKLISVFLVVSLFLSSFNNFTVFGSGLVNVEGNEALGALSNQEIASGSAIDSNQEIATGSAIDANSPDRENVEVVTGPAITLIETTDHELYYEDREELVGMILQAEENGTIDESPELYGFGTEDVKAMFVEKYDALYYVDHEEFPDESSIYLFVDSVFDEKTGRREKLDLIFLMVNPTNNKQRFTVGVKGLEKVTTLTTEYSIVVPEREAAKAPPAEETTGAVEEETTTSAVEEETTTSAVEEETTTLAVEEETTTSAVEEETTTSAVEEETTTVEEETTTVEEETTTLEEPTTTNELPSQVSISRNIVGMLTLFSDADGFIEETSAPEEEVKWEEKGTRSFTSNLMTANVSSVLTQEMPGMSLFAFVPADKYLEANFFDYSIEGYNTNINAVISALPGGASDKLYIGTGVNSAPQNSYDGRNIVTLGIAKDNLLNENIAFNYTTVDLFPSSGNGVNGLTPYRGYGFPLKDVGNGYYEFNSANNHIYMQDYTTVDGLNQLSLLTGPNLISGKGTFFPFNNSSNESPNYYFGVKLTTKFLMPKDGMLGNEHMIFEFSGDDDVWIYIDGKLALDLGGIHGIVNGKIDFASGLITIDRIASGSRGTQIAYWYLYNDKTLSQASSALGKNITKVVGLQKVDYKEYDFQMYYMERGASVSNFYARMNFPMIDKDKVSVVKDVQQMPVGTNDTYQFELYVEGEYKESITVGAGSIGTFGTEVYSGEVYYVKEVSTGDYATSWTSKITDTLPEDIVAGAQTNDLDIDTVNVVKFINSYNPSGNLTIGKTVEGDSADIIEGFEFTVTLKDKDDLPLTSIKVGDTSVTLTNGIYVVVLGNGANITISELPIGTKYRVEETALSNAYYDISLNNILRTIVSFGQVTSTVTNNPSIDEAVTGTIGIQNNETVSIDIEKHNNQGTYKIFLDNSSGFREFDIFMNFLESNMSYVISDEVKESIWEMPNDSVKSFLFQKNEIIPQNITLDFTNSVNLITGSITLDKSLVEADAKDTNHFIFKLSNTDPNSPGNGAIAYGSIAVNQGATSGNSFTFENLPMGSYQIVELDHMRYDLVSLTGEGIVVLTKDTELTRNKEVDALNKKETDGYFSDSALAVNKGEWVDGRIIFNSQEAFIVNENNVFALKDEEEILD